LHNAVSILDLLSLSTDVEAIVGKLLKCRVGIIDRAVIALELLKVTELLAIVVEWLLSELLAKVVIWLLSELLAIVVIWLLSKLLTIVIVRLLSVLLAIVHEWLLSIQMPIVEEWLLAILLTEELSIVQELLTKWLLSKELCIVHQLLLLLQAISCSQLDRINDGVISSNNHCIGNHLLWQLVQSGKVGKRVADRQHEQRIVVAY